MADASVVSADEAEQVHEQMHDKQRSLLYACKDTTLLPDAEYAVCVVHVAASADMSEQFMKAITYLANLYLGAADAPLYVLHVFAGSNKLDISFADTAHAPALVERIEQAGIAPFLRACAQAFTAPHCNMAYLYYDTFADMEAVKHTVVLGHNIALPLSERTHAQLNGLLRVCQKQ